MVGCTRRRRRALFYRLFRLERVCRSQMKGEVGHRMCSPMARTPSPASFQLPSLQPLLPSSRGLSELKVQCAVKSSSAVPTMNALHTGSLDQMSTTTESEIIHDTGNNKNTLRLFDDAGKRTTCGAPWSWARRYEITG